MLEQKKAFIKKKADGKKNKISLFSSVLKKTYGWIISVAFFCAKRLTPV
jgi:hypothetical protein